MNKLGLIFIFSGALLMGLSGLEKILIFTSFNGNAHQMQAIIDLTPSYLWNITNFTFGFGLVSFILGLINFFRKYLYQVIKQ
ncbi:hypothetical protein [Lentibacillus sp. CBA3610]|uniref:hypothetical protein n=1 Tax=Lentibacillus sp. CBA3610 TaxID=2518176 RepID=UPI001594F8EC|nr:hypothetical protein [Lentibacillus sp. CBA3610]QKY70677.1 hypothetical protein Len3610_14715 [Lentibacillus sp. CBA3610]